MNAYGNIANVPILAAPTLTPTHTLTYTPTLTQTANPNMVAYHLPGRHSDGHRHSDPRLTSVALTQAASSQKATEAACSWDYAAVINAEYTKYEQNQSLFRSGEFGIYARNHLCQFGYL